MFSCLQHKKDLVCTVLNVIMVKWCSLSTMSYADHVRVVCCLLHGLRVVLKSRSSWQKPATKFLIIAERPIWRVTLLLAVLPWLHQVVVLPFRAFCREQI